MMTNELFKMHRLPRGYLIDKASGGDEVVRALKAKPWMPVTGTRLQNKKRLCLFIIINLFVLKRL